MRLGKRTFRLGSAAVRAPAVRLVAAGDVVVDADGSLVVADVLGNQVVRLTGTRLTRLARLEFPVEVALDPAAASPS